MCIMKTPLDAARMELILITTAIKLLPHVLPLLEDERTGCALTLRCEIDGYSSDTTLFLGDSPQEKRAKYWNVSRYKMWGLMGAPDHIVSTFEIKNEAKSIFPGGIRAGVWIISISGFTALDDESFALLIASKAELLTKAGCDAIAQKSNNVERLNHMSSALLKL